jgi:hypothetical protein
LATRWCGSFCFTEVVGLAIALTVAFRRPSDGSCGAAAWLGFIAGGLAAAVVLVVFTMTRGGTPAAMVQSLVLDPLRFSAGFLVTFDVGRASIATAIMIAVVAALVIRAEGRPWRFPAESLMAWMKFGTAALTVVGAAGFPQLLPRVAPCLCWLVLVPPGHRVTTVAETFFRRLLCFVTLLQILQIYPVAVFQVGIGTIGFIPLGVLCLADWAETMAAAQAGRGVGWTRLAVAAVGLVVAAIVVVDAGRAGLSYRECEPVDFPGFRLSRMPEDQAAFYRCMVGSLQSSDAFFSTVGLNSVYFWLGRTAPQTSVMSFGWDGLSDDVQQQMVRDYRGVGDVIVVYHKSWCSRQPWQKTVFGQYVVSEFRPYAKVYGHTLMRRADRGEKNVPGCAWYKKDESRGSDHASAQRPVELGLNLAGTIPLHAARFVVLDLHGGTQMADVATDKPIVVSGETVLEGAEFPAVRFLDAAGRRIRTVPVVCLDPGAP